ncbi:MAG: hypothetical protein LQ343_004348 [Gyalolechia ehrenbergii]|nr:MAG: hypothetical protein LQ343_004348 [Gyalolechia ehrenbergii]
MESLKGVNGLGARPMTHLQAIIAAFGRPQQAPLTDSQASHVAENVTTELFNDLEELSRIVDIAYCEYVPYPGDDGDEQEENFSRSWRHLFPRSVNPKSSRCDGCMVHAGFMASWRHTRPQLIDTLEDLVNQYPNYQLTLVGHSLGGAVAALASLDLHAKGWNPQVTTFGEPRIGNQALMKYIDKAFCNESSSNASRHYRRVTHIDDPVPLLPLNEWGYNMHAGEVYISKSDLPPEKDDLRLCEGDEDPRCIAGAEVVSNRSLSRLEPGADIESFKKWWIESQGLLEVPARFRIWQLFFAHRDYFWRLGLCIPGGIPEDWYRKYL